MFVVEFVQNEMVRIMSFSLCIFILDNLVTMEERSCQKKFLIIFLQKIIAGKKLEVFTYH